jgi:tetratricopeptide (TPR) repeat protein
MAHPEELDKDTLYQLRTLLARYPYSQSLRLLYLKNLYMLHDIMFGGELRKSVCYITDRRVLFYLIEGDKYRLGLDRTLSLIDAFLTSTSETDVLPNGLDYAITDYTGALDVSAEELGRDVPPPLKGQDLIDGFLAKAESGASMKPKPLNEEEEAALEQPSFAFTEADDEDTCFTETLARIYIKQRRYRKALEIIKKLSLNYPKKNAYFADQIRFLEKLIINTKT